MPSTHLALHVHVIFSTKDRMPLIAPDWLDRLHSFAGGVVGNLGAVPEAVGGVSDHMHLLIGLRATHSVAEVVRSVKAVSSRWVHEEIGMPKFSWQEGYGAFSVSPSQCPVVRDYINGQAEHHRKKGFQEEYLEFLKKCGVEFDERFVW
ncbi:IS200/IS605 family transposase [Luteolibacter flavescens]|uniref:IS200/IS605 family transposase n=1 Tax=Luteolibacter flavescens TaxID=1859460 RepID=A0ABT3FUY1_9BACT|nr:IS200/IS605 family transposase [Luteolibacter flavescens]MCW1887099.1 IS200/IS605 family transposase [Luteolibacter flavescens]